MLAHSSLKIVRLDCVKQSPVFVRTEAGCPTLSMVFRSGQGDFGLIGRLPGFKNRHVGFYTPDPGIFSCLPRPGLNDVPEPLLRLGSDVLRITLRSNRLRDANQSEAGIRAFEALAWQWDSAVGEAECSVGMEKDTWLPT